MTIRLRVALGVLLAALLPLAIAATLSIVISRDVAEQAVSQGNLNTAVQAAGRIEGFLDNQRGILAALAQTVAPSSGLTERQIQAVLRNHVLDFAAFHELAVYGVDARERIGVRRGHARSLAEEPELARKALAGKAVLGSYYIGETDLQPGVAMAVPIEGSDGPVGALVGQIELIELWRLADQIRIGTQGYALITDAGGRVLAGGSPALKAKALLGEEVAPEAGIATIFRGGRPQVGARVGALGEDVVAAAAPLPDLGVVVVVEQPTAEAFASAGTLGLQLLLVALLVGGGALGVSLVGSRRPLRLLEQLSASVRAVASGNFDVKAPETDGDEIGRLSRAFNAMTVQLRDLTEAVRRQERMLVFARIAAGLAHDLRHPIKNLENQARLLLESPDDARFREAFRRTVERDFGALDRFLGDLHDLTQVPQMTVLPLDVRTLVEAAGEGVAGQAAEREVPIQVAVEDPSARLLGDRLSLDRAIKNLLVNAIEVSAPGKVVQLLGRVQGGEVLLEVCDQGPGIAPERIGRLFEEFSTTKRSGRGLGLGLALTRRFVQEQGGTIECQSELGVGSTFRIRMPLAQGAGERGAA